MANVFQNGLTINGSYNMPNNQIKKILDRAYGYSLEGTRESELINEVHEWTRMENMNQPMTMEDPFGNTKSFAELYEQRYQGDAERIRHSHKMKNRVNLTDQMNAMMNAGVTVPDEVMRQAMQNIAGPPTVDNHISAAGLNPSHLTYDDLADMQRSMMSHTYKRGEGNVEKFNDSIHWFLNEFGYAKWFNDLRKKEKLSSLSLLKALMNDIKDLDRYGTNEYTRDINKELAKIKEK